MAAALPRHIRLKLEQALGQWRHWRCEPPLGAAPEVVRVLGSGLSNFNVLVRGAADYVVRIDGINPARHGLNRQTEWRALEAASAAGVAPGPRYFNPDLGCLVCDYLPPDEAGEADLSQIATLLRGIHALPARHCRLDLGERILRYEKLLGHAGRDLPSALQRCRDPIGALLQDLGSASQRAVLCHNDLLGANRILSGGRLWAIDWEYCAMGSRWYELAVIAVGDGLSREATGTLVSTYLGRPAAADEWAMLRAYQCVYRYLELLWYLVPDRATQAGPELAARLDTLEQELFNPGSS